MHLNIYWYGHTAVTQVTDRAHEPLVLDDFCFFIFTIYVSSFNFVANYGAIHFHVDFFKNKIAY